MDKGCETCKFTDRDITDEPCGSCCDWSTILDVAGDYKNWQPRRPRRKDLQAQLATASDEIASMHRELAAKQAIIDQQERELAEVKAKQTYTFTLPIMPVRYPVNLTRCSYCGKEVQFGEYHNCPVWTISE